MSKPNVLVTAAVLVPVAVLAWAIVLYVCWAIVSGAATIIEIISRSL